MENKTTNKLNVLLMHWMEHNREHSAEYEKWALQAKAAGFADVCQVLNEASDVIQKTNEKLLKAWEIVRKHTKE